MRRFPFFLRQFLVFSCGLVVLSSLANELLAREPKVVEQQTREFRVSVDGKKGGACFMTLTRRDDGTEIMKGECELKFNFVVVKYHYKSTGTEVWKDGQLLELDNEANFNGDKYVVQASAENRTLDYAVNGKQKRGSSEIWVSSYWHEPNPQKVGQMIKVFDSDKGRELTARLSKVGLEQLALGHQKISATHYTLRGDVHVDLWFDEQNHIVRQETLESGNHRSVLELTRITSPQ